MHFLKGKKKSWYVHIANDEMAEDQQSTRRKY